LVLNHRELKVIGAFVLIANRNDLATYETTRMQRRMRMRYKRRRRKRRKKRKRRRKKKKMEKERRTE